MSFLCKLTGPTSRVSYMETKTVFSWVLDLGFPFVPTGVHSPEGLI